MWFFVFVLFFWVLFCFVCFFKGHEEAPVTEEKIPNFHITDVNISTQKTPSWEERVHKVTSCLQNWQCPSQNRPVRFFNSIRITENVLSDGGVLAEDKPIVHPMWEMPSHAYQLWMARMWTAGALSPGTGMEVRTASWDAICQQAMFTIVGTFPASWSRDVDGSVH